MHKFSTVQFPFPLHSIMIWHKGQILQEEYYAPFERGMHHRMFSITKSYTSLAIGALIAEGQLQLSDRICTLFPEYTPADAHPYLTEMTIEDMLGMRTCHRSTTYKLDSDSHWVRSFFATTPDHHPGRIFKYDTSSAHTLAALVKKISGKGILDYLRSVCLDRIGFSADAHVLTDPFGCEIGGSGLIATVDDLLNTAKLVLSLYRNTWEQDYPYLIGSADTVYNHAFWKRYADYIHSALSYHSPTLHEGKTVDECRGYGWQFWMLRNGGVMMYGMGGQYVVLYPDEELIFITTADSQMIQGGSQMILDEIRNSALSIAPRLSGYGHTDKPALNETLFGSWKSASDKSALSFMSLTDSSLTLKAQDKKFVFPYSLTEDIKSREKVYDQTVYTRAFPQPDGSLYLRIAILDDYVGSIHILINAAKDNATLYLRKIEESLYSEFNGFFELSRRSFPLNSRSPKTV